MAYWLLKTEPNAYSLDDLKRDKVGVWDGVRNYLARNNLRAMKNGDGVLVYHSSIAVPAIVGVGKVVKEGYPDPSQFKRSSKYFDAASKRENPRWTAVDVRFVKKFNKPITLNELKLDPRFADMLLTKQGIRLSVQPVKATHWSLITKRN